ncbi:TPM domain-containing protein [Pollutimonas bauzanensis]|uniref:TLP18.3, Psb32 and MOLO-1 founding protein of phosphatase n=1 Tax=Pollutimonas bauzanensis TaxID=658167 RepID=A0A1M5V6C7_9BURK|nr:TPM domain-containing protein [Pollutimonas bauzanensis]SHH70765.1 TLP18.3, Psb32 and MOLO-1 founding protein of phosphatase [Pollutimonas bauzanensis]
MRQDGGKWKELTGWASLEGQWLRRRHFTPEVLAHIADRIKKSELDHTGELMVAIEAVSPSHERNSRYRALEVFGRLRVWDTPLNTGVLLYLALDRHRIEIIADRAVAAPDELWAQVCGQLQARLQQHDYAAGILAAIDGIEAILRTRCPPLPPGQAHTNDLADEPVFL